MHKFDLPLILSAVMLGVSACATVAPYASNETLDVKTVTPFAETPAVASSEDAADDPAIWVHPEDVSKSLILGTDKQAGLYVYNLKGEFLQFLKAGRVNNVDVRLLGKGIKISNRTRIGGFHLNVITGLHLV